VKPTKTNIYILNKSLKIKAMVDFCERPRKLIHKELRSQYLDNLTYRDIMNISRNTRKNMYTARSFRLLPFPSYIEERREALSALHVLTNSRELAY
jgi:hypothetical protein